MKILLFLFSIIAISTFASCNIGCNCSEEWDPEVTYKKYNSVSYDGGCWKAVAQGRGIEPGPWLENGNDIWVPCDD